MKLILVRHGETEENKLRVFQGTKFGTLSQKGINQAKKLALRLKDEDIDFIYTSDLGRAFNTAKEVHKYHKEIPLITNKLLRECDFGDWTGKCRNDLDLTKPPSNIEPPKEVQSRMFKFLKSIDNNKHKDKTILIVSHCGTVVSLLSHYMNKDIDKMWDMKQGNTAINIIEIKGNKKHKIHLINCTNHLD